MINQILTERGERYGSYGKNCVFSQRTLNGIMYWWQGKKDQPSEPLFDSVIKNTVTNIVLKLSRIHNGDRTYTDNYTDILGYTELTFQALSITFPKPEEVESLTVRGETFEAQICECLIQIVCGRNNVKSQPLQRNAIIRISRALMTISRLTQVEIDKINAHNIRHVATTHVASVI